MATTPTALPLTGPPASPPGEELPGHGTYTIADPATLDIGPNIRSDADLDPHFCSDVAEHGVEVAIDVRRRGRDGVLVVRDGQRRTLAARRAGLAAVPVLIRPGAGAGGVGDSDVGDGVEMPRLKRTPPGAGSVRPGPAGSRWEVAPGIPPQAATADHDGQDDHDGQGRGIGDAADDAQPWPALHGDDARDLPRAVTPRGREAIGGGSSLDRRPDRLTDSDGARRSLGGSLGGSHDDHAGPGDATGTEPRDPGATLPDRPAPRAAGAPGRPREGRATSAGSGRGAAIRRERGSTGLLRPSSPPVAVPSGPSSSTGADRGEHHNGPLRQVSLDPGVHTAGEDGTRIWLPGPARSAEPGPEPGPVPRVDPCVDPDIGSAVGPRAGRGGTEVTRAGPGRGDVLVGALAKLERIDDGEARAFAARFATDYLSWDEDDQTRRPQVLRGYLADPRASTLGWSGTGRQRADAPLPGRLDRRSDTVAFVEVTLRVTTYSRACPSSDPPVAHTDDPTHALGPSSAPAGDPDAWVAGRAHWVQMAVPITRDQRGHLVVDLSLVPGPADR